MTSHKAWRNMQKSIFEPLTWKCNWKLSCTESDFKLRLQKVSNTSTKPACARRMWSVWNIEKWPDGYIIFSKLGHLEQSKIAQTYKIFAKVGSQFCQILNSYSRNGQKLFKILSKCRNFAKSGHTAYYLSLTTHLSTQSQRHSYLHSQCVPLLSTVMQYYLLTL